MVFNINGPVKLARRPVKAASRPAAEKQALAQRLKALHNHELQKVGFHILRLFENERDKHELSGFTENFRRTYVFPPTDIEIIYEDIEGGRAFSKAEGMKVLFAYIPFKIEGEELVLKLFRPGGEEIFGDLTREPTEVLLEQKHGDYTYQYMWREDYEDIRQYFIRQTFDLEANVPLEERRNQTWLVKSDKFRELIAYQIPGLIGEGKRVLSVGLGQGDMEEILIQKYNMEVVGVDLSPEMAKVARGKGIEVIVGDGHQLSTLVSGMFDAVIFPESIGYFDIEKVLEQASKVLVPGGKLFIVTYTVMEGVTIGGYRRYPYEEMVKLIEAHPFKIERARTFFPFPDGRIVISKEDADLSQAEKTVPILYFRASRLK